MTSPLEGDPEHARLRASGPTQHCGHAMCAVMLPDPDAWRTALASNPAYDPECCCPCLACHPPGVPYEAALETVRATYGAQWARSMATERAKAIAA
jgi:hypothetical protein